VEKLRDYTKSLIGTLAPKSVNLHHAPSEEPPHIVATKGSMPDNALLLTDEMFPLVSTYDRFLELLENTVRWVFRAYESVMLCKSPADTKSSHFRATDRQNFQDSEDISNDCDLQDKLVDFQAF